MPNWVKNIVTVSEDTMNKIKEKYFTDGVLDFNKIIPMPKSLDLTEGNITERAIYYAYICKDDKNKKEIENILKSTKVYGYKNYWEELQHYKKLNHFKDIDDCASDYKPNNDERKLNIKNLEDLGDMYIHNMKEYGVATWYDWRVNNWGSKWGAHDFSYNKTTMIFSIAWTTTIQIFEKLAEEFKNDRIEIRYADECYSNYNNGSIIFENGIGHFATELDEDFAAEVWEEEIEKEENQKDITDEMFD